MSATTFTLSRYDWHRVIDAIHNKQFRASTGSQQRNAEYLAFLLEELVDQHDGEEVTIDTLEELAEYDEGWEPALTIQQAKEALGL